MPRPYRYFTCHAFPQLKVGEAIQTDQQLAIGNENHTATSIFRYEGEADESTFERYLIQHQDEVNVNLIVHRQIVRKAIAVREFQGFYNRDDGYWLLMTDRRTARSMWDRMSRRSEASLHASESKLALDRMHELGSVTGAYFAELTIQDVSGAALFGTEQVMESEEGRHYREQGVVSAVYMQIAAATGLDATIMVTKDRLILVLSTLTEGEDLRLAAELNARFEQGDAVLE